MQHFLLPVRGIRHPIQNTRFRPLPHFMTSEAQDTIKDPKFDALTGWLAGNYNLSRPSAALAPACLAKNKAAPWLCLYVNETLPFVATPQASPDENVVCAPPCICSMENCGVDMQGTGA